MTKKVSNNLYQTPINDNGIYSLSCKVGKHTQKLGTLDATQKFLFITKSQRRYSQKLNAFGIPYKLLDCSELMYDKVFVETKRKLYCSSRSFWKWNGTIIDSPIKRSYLHLDNFRIVSKRGKYEKENTIAS